MQSAYETATHVGYITESRSKPGTFRVEYQARHPKTGLGWQSFKSVRDAADVTIDGYSVPVAYSSHEKALAALTAKLDALAAKKARPGKYAQRLATNA